MQALSPYVVAAPGFFGLNTQDSPTDLESGYALYANNCVIDQYGRIGSRKGWTKVNTATHVNLGTNDIKAIGEHIDNNGTSTIILAGNNRLFKLSGTSLVELTYGGGGVAPTITDSNWTFVSIDGYFIMFQLGHDPLAFMPSVSTTQYRRVSEVAGYTGTVQQADVAIGAFGRCWNAVTTTDKVTIQFSDVKAPHKYSGGTSGTLDLTTVWPAGGDTIVALGAHNNRLFIFGKQHILVYKDATTPASMSLEDAINGIGALSKDCLSLTGTDIIFLSQTGVRSVMRTIQEKSAPIRDLSKTVRNDLLLNLANETVSDVFSTWNAKEGFYLLHFPTSALTYCFDTKQALPDGAARVTTWTGLNPTAMFTSLDGTLYLGKQGYLGTYSGYLDDASSYTMTYQSTYTDFGAPVATSMIKRINITVIGGSNQAITTSWGYDYGGSFAFQQSYTTPTANIGQFNISYFNVQEFSSGQTISVLNSNSTGSGKVAQVGLSTVINGYPVSIQKIEVYAKNGKLA